MNEAEWWAGANDLPTIFVLAERRASLRKLRLFGVACLRRVDHLIDDARCRAAVDAVERYADEPAGGVADLRASESPLAELWANLPELIEDSWPTAKYVTAAVRHLQTRGNIWYAASFARRALASAAGHEKDGFAWDAVCETEASIQVEIIRDVIGRPDRPFGFDSTWLAGAGQAAVVAARKIDEGGNFAAMPDLARTLERAGCTDRAVLDHCRGPGPHVRGCWVVDALLGREPSVAVGLQTEADWRNYPDPTSLFRFLRDRGTEHRWRRFAVACCRRIDHWIVDQRLRAVVDAADQHNDGLIAFEEVEAADRAAEPARYEAGHAEWCAEADANFCITPEYAAAQRDYYAAEATRGPGHRDPRQGTKDEIGRDDPFGWGTAHFWAVAVAGTAVVARADLWDAALNEPGALIEPPGLVYPIADSESVDRRKAYLRVESLAKAAERTERLAQRDLLLDIFGDLIGPTGTDGAWLPAGKDAPVAERWCRLPLPIPVKIEADWLDADDGAGRRLARLIHEAGSFDRLPELADLLQEAGCDDVAILDHLRGPGPHVRGCWVLDRLLGFEPAPSPAPPGEAA